MRRRMSVVVALVVLVAGLAYWWLAKPTQVAQTPSAAVPVELAEVRQQDVPVELRSLGRVRALRSVDIRAQVEGTLLELPVAEGERVRRGALLARIDDRRYAAALRQAEAELQVTRAELTIARRDLTRYRNLVRERAAPSQTLDQQEALVARLEATLGVREAAVAAARVDLSHTRIHAPFDGRLGIRQIDEGSLLRGADSTGLFSVVQTDPIDVEASLPQRRLPELQRLLAEQADAPVRVYQEDDGELLAEGRLMLLDNRVALESGTIRIKARFGNADEHLWPDQSVVVTVQARVLPQVLTVPLEAVRLRAEGPFVWRVTEGVAEPVAVSVRYETERLAVVEGLAVGDQVVIDGHSRLRAGVAVRRTELPAVAPEGV
ncbi:efflux RND transporter periplasmic adaptor subunit [Stutzerimonas azotifigens]|uniref:efflux RND transporter periplasmic adaptor subunit n=1 Tax=Stutzerimonas azotifigens TaxID=291995 RepID=UPI001EEE87F4|nr:efflux RND transporter periplasmic adaptor subunit [Stutzerimonas azotifigens]